MALGKQQGRPVNPNDDFGFNVATYTGAVVTTDAFAIGTAITGTLDTIETLSAVVDGGANAATFDIASDGDDNGIDSLTVTLVGGDTGYAVGDTVALSLIGFTNVTVGTVEATVVSVAGDTATFDTITGTGTVGFLATDIIQVDELSSAGSGTGLSVSVDAVDGNGLPTGFTAITFGSDYVTAETQTYIGDGELGFTGTASDYFDHDQYEQGGQIDEYKSGTGLIVTGDAATITAITVVGGGVDYRVGDRFSVSPDYNGAGVDAIGVVATVDETGEVLTATVETGGTLYDSAESNNTVFLSRTLNTTATGEYAGANSDNDPTISTGRLADGQQWKVQKLYIDGGTIEVFAEPTTVNNVGQVVGNIVRAEDITDEYRCVSAYLSDGVTPRFKWVTSTTGDADGASYGYCTEKPAEELSGDAQVDADCPAGYVHSAADCVVVDIATINSKEAVWDADRTTDGTTGTNSKQALEQCLANSGYYEVSEAAGSRCIDASVADNFSLANFAYGTVSSAQDYAATVCRQEGYDWITPDMTCVAKADVTTFVTQTTCAAAGHVWVAGTCYDKADFGDGYSRQGNAGDPNTQPK